MTGIVKIIAYNSLMEISGLFIIRGAVFVINHKMITAP